MTRVWKIGSRYGSYGDITRVFWKYQVVFAGNNTERILREVKEGHLIAVASGFTVIAVAKVLEPPAPVERLGLNEDDVKLFPGAVGARVRLLSLHEEDRIKYRDRRSFVGANLIASRVRELYKQYLNAFEIRSHVYCLYTGEGSAGNLSSLVGGKTIKYTIPIYQRPYSWGETQLSRFLADLGNGFKDGTAYFAGPIQLSFPIPVDPEKGTYFQEVIDGQQRLTTLRLLLKILAERVGGTALNPAIGGDWLETLVNRGEQQRALQIALAASLSEIEDHPERETNPYIKNLTILQGLVEELLADEQENIQATDFINYLCSNIRLVGVETYAGLSKTLQVFNTINTAGLDLGGSDLFKIRFYEYLTRKNGQRNDAAFQAISKLYEDVDRRNREHERPVSSMKEIIGLFKYKTIASSALPNGLWKIAGTTFFDRFFDTVIGVQEWSRFGHASDVEIKVEDIEQVIDARYRFEAIKSNLSVEALCGLQFILGSRYERFWIVFPLYLDYYRHSEESSLLNEFVIALAKLFIVYSTVYAKRINNIVSFVMDIIGSMAERIPVDELLEIIRNKTADPSIEGEFKNRITQHLASNSKGKNLVCRLAGMQHELETLDKNSHANIVNWLFKQELDIEHIQPVQDKDGERRHDIEQKWGADIHSIGNLVVLERKINRGISNRPVHEKAKGYAKSRFKQVQKLASQYGVEGSFDHDACQKRQSEEAKRIMKYLFDHENVTEHSSEK